MPVVSYLPAEILDYVETHAPSEETAFGISQRELAKALGYHPSSMSRPLAELVEKGFLRTQRGIVRGGQRKQFVYALTEDGRTTLRRQTQEVPLLSGALPPPPNPFLGRKEELRELMGYSQGGGAVVFLDGPAGIGKTALVSRHLRRLKAGRVPFWFTVRAGASSRQFAVALAHALAPLGAQQLAYYSQLPRQPVGREVADLAQRALGARELITVVDDVHSATVDMRRFLEEFVGGLSKGRHDLFFMLGHDAPFFQIEGLRTQRLVLGGLDRASAHELTDRRGGLADRFESVYQASLGSPLLLQLSVSVPGVEATPLALPAAVVERMPRDELLGLLPVALANEPIPASFVTEMSGLPQERLSQLTQAGILQRASEGRLELLQVVRTALMTKTTPGEEREAHLTLAGFYGRSHRPESVRERFLHLVAGESWKQASDVLAHQERTLLSLGYSDTLRNALRHLGLAIAKGAARVRALRVEANLLRLHSEYAEAILSLRRAVVESDRDQRVETECLFQIVELYVRMRQIDEADRALREARERAPPSRRFDVYLALSEARVIEARGDLVRAQSLFQQAFQFGKKWRVADLALEAIAAWSRIVSLGGDREAALAVVEEALPDARASGRLDITFNLLLVRARAYAELGDKAQAEAEMRLIRVEAEALGYLSQLTYTLSGLCAMAVDGKRWNEGVGYARQAIALAERLGNDVVLGHTLALLGTAEHRQGQLDEAFDHANRGVTILERQPPSDSLAIARSYLAEICLDRGDVEAARAQYEAALRLVESMGMSWWKEQVQNELEVRLRKAEEAAAP
ncbi:MAG: tetratricopeptide repeat protein [Thermoplasmata archaeon]|nr:tetratricopeptide repeat protein [Thermoplasmata archaeon]